MPSRWPVLASEFLAHCFSIWPMEAIFAARQRISGDNLFAVLFVMVTLSRKLEPPVTPWRFGLCFVCHFGEKFPKW
jgi:hypothetical protein